MSDLTQFRDHARAMSLATEHERPDVGAWCRRLGGASAEHDRCRWGTRCGCRCHDADREPLPTEVERALWTRLADEVDTYLGTPTSEDAVLLFDDGGVCRRVEAP